MAMLYAQRFYMIFTKQNVDQTDPDDGDRPRSLKDSQPTEDSSTAADHSSRTVTPRITRQASGVPKISRLPSTNAPALLEEVRVLKAEVVTLRSALSTSRARVSALEAEYGVLRHMSTSAGGAAHDLEEGDDEDDHDHAYDAYNPQLTASLAVEMTTVAESGASRLLFSTDSSSASSSSLSSSAHDADRSRA